MIVDDESDVVSIFKSVLERHEYNVDGFTDPQLALNEFKVNHEKYALIISDIKMPQMSGFELVRQIKQIYADIYIVLVTAFEVKESEFAMMFPSTKVDELIKKPISSQQLLALAIKYVGVVEQH